MAAPMDYDIYVAYDPVDKDIVFKVCDRLSKDNIKLFLDRNRTDEKLHIKQTRDRISNSTFLISFLSRKFCDSANARIEIIAAHELNKICIHIIIDPDIGYEKVDHGLSFYIAGIVCLKAFSPPDTFEPWSEEVYSKLMRSVRHQLERHNKL